MSIFTTLFSRKRPGFTLLSLRVLRDTPRLELENAIRFLCAHAWMSDDVALCRALGRYKIFIDKADLGFSSHIMLDGFWQIWVTQAILRTVREGMFAADVGANVGYYSLVLADLVGQSGHVSAFEPNARAGELLQRSAMLNGFAERISLHNKPFATSSRDLGKRLRKFPSGPKRRHTSSDPPSTCLDDVISDGRLDFAKIDGKGAERDIWHGMQRIIARAHPLTIFLEFVVGRYKDPDVFLAEITAAYFKLARVDPFGKMVAVSAQDVLGLPPDTNQTLVLSR